ncbi:MAG TPA: tetratricopeptide repeat protein [Bryobacteraceae bacterium]|nr:tetratricopeptide repeat protein [Bryobacteraceae bacterium]
MSRGRICAVLIVAAGLFPAAKTVFGQLPPPLVPKTELPPDEDKANAVEKFSFNPVQSKREMTAGDFYFKKGNYSAAVARYERATKWNDGNAEAWRRLGEAQEKKSNDKAAMAAYQKFLELSPHAKKADDVRKKLAKLKS